MARLMRRKFRRVLLDIDTQYDLINQLNHDISGILANSRRLIAWSRARKIPVISTALSRQCPENNVFPQGAPMECIDGTPGQKKIRFTLLPNHTVFPAVNRLDLPARLLSEFQQVIFEKRGEDPFTEPRIDRLITELRTDAFVVFGMGVETGVKATVLGLLSRKKKVLLVSDAVNGSPTRQADLALRQMEAKGAKLVSTAGITGKRRIALKLPPQIALPPRIAPRTSAG